MFGGGNKGGEDDTTAAATSAAGGAKDGPAAASASASNKPSAFQLQLEPPLKYTPVTPSVMKGPPPNMMRRMQPPPKLRDVPIQPAIIDTEKLKRMDLIESREDDWTMNDDDFDYNKKLAR